MFNRSRFKILLKNEIITGSKKKLEYTIPNGEIVPSKRSYPWETSLFKNWKIKFINEL